MYRDICGRRCLAIAIAIAERFGLGIAVTNTVTDADAVTDTNGFRISECITESNAVKRSARDAARRRLAERRAQDGESRSESCRNRAPHDLAHAHRQ
jgi:hypothetical protein